MTAAILRTITLLIARYAFGLEETNERDLAEELCYQSLAIDPHNPWATHTLGNIHCVFNIPLSLSLSLSSSYYRRG